VISALDNNQRKKCCGYYYQLVCVEAKKKKQKKRYFEVTYAVFLYQLPEEHQHLLVARNHFRRIGEIGVESLNGIVEKLPHCRIDELKIFHSL